jgi:hypothetical protein
MRLCHGCDKGMWVIPHGMLEQQCEDGGVENIPDNKEARLYIIIGGFQMQEKGKMEKKRDFRCKQWCEPPHI